jgi:hypothetical protein
VDWVKREGVVLPPWDAYSLDNERFGRQEAGRF